MVLPITPEMKQAIATVKKVAGIRKDKNSTLRFVANPKKQSVMVTAWNKTGEVRCNVEVKDVLIAGDEITEHLIESTLVYPFFKKGYTSREFDISSIEIPFNKSNIVDPSIGRKDLVQTKCVSMQSAMVFDMVEKTSYASSESDTRNPFIYIRFKENNNDFDEWEAACSDGKAIILQRYQLTRGQSENLSTMDTEINIPLALAKEVKRIKKVFVTKDANKKVLVKTIRVEVEKDAVPLHLQRKDDQGHYIEEVSLRVGNVELVYSSRWAKQNPLMFNHKVIFENKTHVLLNMDISEIKKALDENPKANVMSFSSAKKEKVTISLYTEERTKRIGQSVNTAILIDERKIKCEVKQDALTLERTYNAKLISEAINFFKDENVNIRLDNDKTQPAIIEVANGHKNRVAMIAPYRIYKAVDNYNQKRL